LIGLALMGNSCEFVARSGTPPPPPDGERPVAGDGLLVVVRTGDSRLLGEAQAVVATDVIVATALSVSALSARRLEPEPEPATFGGSALPIAAPDLERVESVVTHSARLAPSEPVGAIPEPRGWLIFAMGLAVSASCLGRKSSSPSRSSEEATSLPL
jgi:hypothetical protein